MKLINPILRLEDSAAGSLTFKVYNDNLNYSTIKKLFPIISVFRDEKTIFKGRVVTDRKDFYNGKTVEVEGKMAFFNDSYLEPFNFTGTPYDLFAMIVENHNSQVSEWQQFKVGKVTVLDNNDYITRSSEKCLNTWNALKDKCFKSSLGGHIRIRYEKDGDYIDWLSDYETISSQSIEFAKNMIDIVSEVDATETYTAIRPVGAEVNGARIDISSVNYGKKYIVNEEKAKEYGIIFAPEEESKWDDVTLPENLLKKAQEKLFGSFVTLKETYEIKAVDLNLTDKTIEALNVCEYVPVDSKPHGINANYFLRRIDFAIASPQNSIFHLGSVKRVLSDMNTGTAQQADVPSNISAFTNDAGYISAEETEEMLSEYAKEDQVVEIVNQAVADVTKGADGKSAYEIAHDNGFEGTEEEWLESLKGEDGYTPQKGIDYYEGKDGKDGATPTIGENENWFINGKDTGKPSRGATGSPGENGKSAYEVALDDGFEGTETEWLESLKGETGSPGYTPQKGTDYFDGADGQPGADGKSATVEIGTVTTADANTQASVTNSGTDTNAVLDFVIPKGETVGIVAFEVREDGHLWAVSNTDDANSYYINDAGHLIHKIGV